MKSSLLRPCLLASACMVLGSCIRYSSSADVNCTVDTTAQGRALALLFNATHGEAWQHSEGWLDDSLPCEAPSTLGVGETWPAHCCWHGITCCTPPSSDALHAVAHAPNYCPPEHGGGVMVMNLAYNNLIGPFPNDALDNLSCSLSHLYLNSNQLSGTVSPDLGPLEQLQSMNVGYNRLWGPFPAIFGAVPNLRSLALDFNSFTGFLPAEVCPINNTKLTDLSASHNYFLALIVNQCTSLISLVGGNNPFGPISAMVSASAPNFIDDLAMLHIIRINNADLSFSLRKGLIFSPTFSVYSMSSNRVMGALVDEMATMTSLLIMEFAQNPLLRGTLPASFSRIMSLTSLDLTNTGVHGTIPDSWQFIINSGNTVIALEQTLLGCCFGVTYLDAGNATDTKTYVQQVVFGPFNQSAKRLPDFLTFADTFSSVPPSRVSGDRHIQCPDTTVNSSSGQAVVYLNPLYFMYEGCKCDPGYDASYVPEDPTGVFLTCTIKQFAKPPGTSTTLIAAATVAPTCLALLMGAVAMFLWRRSSRERHLTLFGGKVKPPLATSETTLLVTDIEDSSVLWETASTVMDQALEMHHDIIRRCALQHGGYESATEGDSFILAFHSAPAAVRFAVEVQTELLNCDWPVGLYDALPGCARMYVAAPSEDPPHDNGSPLAPASSALRKLFRRLPFLRRRSSSKPSVQLVVASSPSAAALQSAPSTSPLHSAFSMMSPRGGGGSGAFGDRGDGSVHGSRQRPTSPFGQSNSSRPLLWLRQTSNVIAADNSSPLASSVRPRTPVEVSAAAVCVASLSNGGGGGGDRLMHTATVHDHLMHVAGQAAGPAAGSTVMLFSGLRVRMGMATGMSDPDDVSHNRAAGRTSYQGAFMAAARAVQDAAQGGMVLISEATFEQLPAQELLASNVLVAHMGEHRLKGLDNPTHLYAVVSHTLLPRLALLGPVRSVEQLSSSFLSAPFRRAAIAFMTAAGKDALMAWNKEVAQQSLAVYQRTVQAELSRCGGYLVEAPDGLCLAAFGISNTDAAIRWAVRSVALCLVANWPVRLFTHELGEKVFVSQPVDLMFAREAAMSDSGGASTMPHSLSVANKAQVLFSGLRVKCGIDVGEVVADVHAVQGRMTYRGRVMNRAARIGTVAQSGQVWCSKAAWDKAGSLHMRRQRRSSRGVTHGDVAAELRPAAFAVAIAAAAADVSPHMSRQSSGQMQLLPAFGSNGGAAATVAAPVHCAIRGMSLGPYRLKGVGDMELVHCSPQGDVLGPTHRDFSGGNAERQSHCGGGVGIGRVSRTTRERSSRDSSRSGQTASLSIEPPVAEGVEEGEEDELEGPIDGRAAVLVPAEVWEEDIVLVEDTRATFALAAADGRETTM